MRRNKPILLLLALFVVSCQSEEPGTSAAENEPSPAAITVGVIHERPDSLAFEVDDRAFEIDTLAVTFGVTELHLCEETSLGFSLVPSAYAHVPSTGTRLGTVFTEDLTSATGAAQIVGEFEPIHGTYCSAVLVAAPADDDVLNMSAVPTDELIGNSLVVAGTIDGERFRWSTSRSALAQVALDHLSVESGTAIQLLFDKRVSRELFGELAALDTDEARAERILTRLMGTVTRWEKK